MRLKTENSVQLQLEIPGFGWDDPGPLQQAESSFSARRGVRASAGSGKTYELTSYYLRALLQGAEPSSLLATTFTRKAAGEILGRVMERLAVSCNSEGAFQTLAADLELPHLSQEDARTCLKRLCNSLHQVSISTIDSFFGKLMRCFSHELGVSSNTRMLTETDSEMVDLRREAIRRLLGDREPSEVAAILSDFYGGKARRGITSGLEKELIGAHELFLTTSEQMWEPNFSIGKLLSDSELRTQLDALEALFSQPQLGAMANTIAQDFGRAHTNQWAEFLVKGVATKVAGKEENFNRKPIPGDVYDLYEPLVNHARAVILSRHVNRTRALYDLLALYDFHYQTLTRQRKVMLFRDVPVRLGKLLNSELGPEIAHRLDAGIEHLLLDEFQDTDPQQYAILKPIAEQIHALPQEQGLIFCVGDLKQSIYGWRGATPEIFKRIGADLPHMVWKDNDSSYRSSQVILDAVNRLFSDLPSNETLQTKAPRVREAWKGVFRAHVAMKELSGFVEVIETPVDGEAEAEEVIEDDAGQAPINAHLKFVAEQVQKMVEVWPEKTIGILMRGNAPVRAMIAELGRLGVAASAEAGTPIMDDPAVAVVLSALKLADHPADSTAAFHIMNSPLGSVLGFPESKPHEVASQVRRSLLERGFPRTIERWSRILAPYTDEQGVKRLLQLLEMADAYSVNPGFRPAEFVKFVRSQTVEESSAALVRVMTIHKSKGLEFDAVVLPELHAQIKMRPHLLQRRDESGNVVGVSVYPDSTVRKLEPKLDEMYQAVEDRQHVESLCLLYVAMTRARRALHVFMPPLQKFKDGSNPLSLASILKSGLVVGGLTGGEEGCLYRAGDPEWWLADAKKIEVAPIPESELPPIIVPSLHQTQRRGLRQARPSDAVGQSRQSARQLLGDLDSPAKRRGTVLHALLSHVTWAGQLSSPNINLMQLASRAVPGIEEAEIQAYLQEFENILLHPTFLEAVAKPESKADEESELWLERVFTCIMNGSLITGQVDRVVIIRSNDVPVRAEILDYKSDQTEADMVAFRVKDYRPQINLYRDALAVVLNLDAELIDAKILFTTPGILVAVDRDG